MGKEGKRLIGVLEEKEWEVFNGKIRGDDKSGFRGVSWLRGEAEKRVVRRKRRTEKRRREGGRAGKRK